jgi:hypothetical protein
LGTLRINKTISPTPPGILIESCGIAVQVLLFVDWLPLLCAEMIICPPS